MYNSLFFNLYFYHPQNLRDTYLPILLNEKVNLTHSKYGFSFSKNYNIENLKSKNRAKKKFLELLKLDKEDFSFYLYFEDETIGTNHIFSKRESNKISIEFLRPKILLNTNLADVSYYSFFLNRLFNFEDIVKVEIIQFRD